VADELNIRFRDRRFRSFRCAVAFARWSGLHLIDGPLRAFASRDRNRIDCLIGIDLGGTTIEALTYLSELPNSRVRVVRSGMTYVVFHPKVFAFEGPRNWSAIVGSSNLSTGGLFSNIESYIILDGDMSDRKVLDDLFAPYDRLPFTDDHARSVDAAFLAELAADLARYTSTPPDRQPGSRASDPAPLDPTFVPPRPPGRPPEAPTGRGGRRPQGHVVPVPTAPDRLYMELWDETGGGTQVQIAKRVFEEYFGASEGATTYVSLDTPAGPMPAKRLQWFSNATFRIGLPFVGGSPAGFGRRGVLRFTRIDQDHYRVDLQLAGEPRYEKWLQLCDDEIGAGRKHWGVH
jgi:hypothetical protein